MMDFANNYITFCHSWQVVSHITKHKVLIRGGAMS